MLRRSLRQAGTIVALVAALVAPAALVAGAWPSLLVLVLLGAMGAAARRLDHGPVELAAGRLGRLAEAATTWSLAVVVLSVATMALARAGGPAAVGLRDPVSALFETTSGLTTTGLTMVVAPERLGAVLQWWRTVLQATGAVGVVVFAIMVGEPSGDRDEGVGAEWSSSPPGGPTTTARRIVLLLGGLAGLGTLGLVLTGDPLWQAVNHAITAAATGGFTIAANSVADSSAGARLVLAAVVLAAGLSFGTLWGAVTRRGPPLHRRSQVRASVALLCLTALPAAAFAMSEGLSVWDALFDAVSASTTAGFSAGTAQQLVPVVAVLASVAMLVGGSVGSSAGGVKVARVAWLARSVGRYLPAEADPDASPYEWDGDEVAPDDAMRRIVGSGALVAIWLVAVVAGVVVLGALVDRPLVDLVFEVVSAASGTGLSTGLTSVDLAAGPKVVLVALMLAGRLEFTAFAALAVHAARSRAADDGDGVDEDGEEDESAGVAA